MKANFSMAAAENGLTAVMVRADDKRDAQEAIKVAKAWIWHAGMRLKLVYFHEIIGTQWSSLGRSYSARIVFKAAQS